MTISMYQIEQAARSVRVAEEEFARVSKQLSVTVEYRAEGEGSTRRLNDEDVLRAVVDAIRASFKLDLDDKRRDLGVMMKAYQQSGAA